LFGQQRDQSRQFGRAAAISACSRTLFLLLLQLLHLSGVVDELKNHLDEALDHQKLKIAPDIRHVQLNQAIEKVYEATKCDELLLPYTLLLIGDEHLDDHLVRLCVHHIIVELIIARWQRHVDELSLHDLKAVK